MIDELVFIENLSRDEESKKELSQILEKVLIEFRERNMQGYIYVIYVGDGLYKIGKTANLERRLNELSEERVVRLIRAENITKLENQLHKQFSNKRITSSQELFKLNDSDILYIHTLPDEWEDTSRIF